MFVVNEFRKLLRIGLLQHVETGGVVAERFLQPVHQPFRKLRAEGTDQHFLCVFRAALDDERLRHRHLMELFENPNRLAGN